MENVYNQSILEYLHSLSALEPVPTGMDEKIQTSLDVKAIIFDIYGTLLISASGDIDQAVERNLFVEKALEVSGISASAEFVATAILAYKAEIKKVHRIAHKKSITHPEVDVIAIWKQVFANNDIEANELQVMQYSFMYEVQSNPVYPMPNMVKVLEQLTDQGIPLGIVSNAQYYTLPIMNHFIEDSIQNQESVTMFDADLCAFSFREHIAKPDLRLYKKVSKSLKEKYGITPDQCLYIGNDMYRDVYPANKLGFKTVLYAGDQRSIRLRKEHKDVIGLVPDYVITELDQIFKILNQE